MDSTIDDFFDEINKIAPSKRKKIEQECDWKECFDDKSGYTYYWNTKTDQVTWEVPKDYKMWQELHGKVAPQLKNIEVPKNVKVYRIADSQILHSNQAKNQSDKKEMKFELEKKHKNKLLVPAYDSETDESDKDENKTPLIESGKEETDSLSTINKNNAFAEGNSNNTKKQLTGFSLVAGYGDSEDENSEDEENKTSSPEKAVSNLFPIVNTIDVKQFKEPEAEETPIESKQFQRKKRISLEFTTAKLAPFPKENKEENKEQTRFQKEYPGFKRGEVLFLNPENSSKNLESKQKDDEEEPDDYKNIEEIRETLSEKLGFLSESREPASAVQVLYIQMETLNDALKAKSLTGKYFLNWLKETCSQLVKLEQGAAPDGWSLQWDRSNKRYFYFNRVTGENQWEYPSDEGQAHRSGEEAMDICTTPPPTSEKGDESSTTSSPPPDRILPPSPPLVSHNIHPSSPLPPSTTSNIDTDTNSSNRVNQLDSSNRGKDKLVEELSNFYTDIAALDKEEAEGAHVSSVTTTSTEIAAITESLPKKSKKMKISQGLSLKKKGVSKLVEKWKNVQKDL